MAYTDYTYYVNEINVPANAMGTDSFESVIDRYEPEILQYLLGYQLYELLKASPTDARFVALIEGDEFSFNYAGTTINTKWEGLKNSKKISLLSYYVYYSYRNQNETFFSGIGQVQSLGENSTKVDARPKLIDIWNKMTLLYGVTPNEIISDEYFVNQDVYSHYNIYPSAYNFLLANIETYPEWIFKPMERLNIFDI